MEAFLSAYLTFTDPLLVILFAHLSPGLFVFFSYDFIKVFSIYLLYISYSRVIFLWDLNFMISNDYGIPSRIKRNQKIDSLENILLLIFSYFNYYIFYMEFIIYENVYKKVLKFNMIFWMQYCQRSKQF